MNTLYGLPPVAGLRQGSPWVMKVQLAMRCLKIDYDLNQVDLMQVRTRAPDGKVPWLVIDGHTISGSERILGELEKFSDGTKFPVPEVCDDAQGILFSRLVEDHLFWLICASKYFGPEAKKGYEAIFPSLPRFVCHLLALIGEKAMKRRIKITSLDGLSHEEIVQEARKDIAVLSARFSHSTFIAGNGLSVHDFSVAAHLASILYWSFDNWLADLFREDQIFYRYLDRVADAVGGFEFRS